MSDVLWFLSAAVYIIGVLLASFALQSKGIIAKEGARKAVHILVSLTVFIIVYCMDDPWLRIAGPLAFIPVNAVLGRFSGERLAGLVCYPLSILTLVVLMEHGLLSSPAVVSGTLAMGLGDGAAALVGTRFGRHRIGGKTLEGSFAMMILSFIIFIMFGDASIPAAVVSALLAAGVEAFTPRGLDNITVPLVSALLMEVI